MLKNQISILCAGILLLLSANAYSQGSVEKSLQSITKAELRDHIYFLASDYMAGRVGPSAEYDIAAHYVASQFASAGIQPLIKSEEGELSWFQKVPFMKTVFGEDIKWTLNTPGSSKEFLHNDDFKILFSTSSKNEKLDLVFVGYGIEEPDHNWNDFEGLDLEGKLLIFLAGTPMKKGKPVLPEEINARYAGVGVQNKIPALFSKGAKAIMMVADGNASGPMSWDNLQSQISTEKYVYQGPKEENASASIPSIYIVKEEILDALFEGQKYNPSIIKEKELKKYKCFTLENTSLETNYEIVDEKLIFSKNIIGIIPGTDPALSNEYITVGAHLDHVAPLGGQVCNGADDNASGTSGVIEIAEALAANPTRRPVIFIAYTAEEMGLYGSDYFIKSATVPAGQIKFNVNLDMIGRSTDQNADTRAHYAVTSKKYLKEIKGFISEINESSINYPLIYDNDEDSPGGSDHMSFINAGIPAFFFFSGVHRDLHQPGDDADKVDYDKATDISRLAYLIANKLANMDEVPDFLEK